MKKGCLSWIRRRLFVLQLRDRLPACYKLVVYPSGKVRYRVVYLADEERLSVLDRKKVVCPAA
jgi:hypothetical protein